MSILWSIVIVIAASLAGFAGVGIFRRISLKRRWLDEPNERSSHTSPTPRGAGVVIFVIVVGAYSGAWLFLGHEISLAYIAGAVLIAAISWVDDLRSLPYLIRFATHIVAASLVVYESGSWPTIGLSNDLSSALGIFGPVVSVLWVVWMINAFNFIDGIDGMAGLQATVAALAWTFVVRTDLGLAVLVLAVAGSCIGFLVHNWSPARVFMGDAGSAFLGYTFGSLAILAARSFDHSPVFLPLIAILMTWPVNFDAGVTRLRKALRFERFWEPHREHFYQKLVSNGFSHTFVTMLYGVFAIASASAGLQMLRFSGPIRYIPAMAILFISIVFAVIVDRADRNHPAKQD